MIFFLQVCLKSYNVLLKRGARGAFFNSSYRLSVLVVDKFIIVPKNLKFFVVLNEPTRTATEVTFIQRRKVLFSSFR